MFLTKDNKIKWKWLGYGAVITLVLVFAGIFWFDKPLYLFMRNFDAPVWRLFDLLFDAKIWLIVSAVVLLFFYIKKSLKVSPKIKNENNKFSLGVFVKDAFLKVHNSYAFYVFCSVLAASVVGKILKILIGRARPIFYEALDMTGFFPLSTEWAFNSMPSGHTFASFAGLVMIGLLAPKVKCTRFWHCPRLACPRCGWCCVLYFRVLIVWLRLVDMHLCRRCLRRTYGIYRHFCMNRTR